MKPRVPLLSPLLRSDTQGRMLAALYLHPEQERTATSLANEVGVSLPTILRDLDRLTNAGFLSHRVSGRNRYVRADRSHPIFAAVAEVLQYSYGPLALLPDMLADIRGIEDAYLFGSWAARYQGEEGSDPHDIDVIVIGRPARMEIYEAATAATERLGRETNIRIVSRNQWQASDDLFIRTVKDGPLVKISLHAASA